jgi:hypothetical protein
MHIRNSRKYSIILKSVLITIAVVLIASDIPCCKGKEDKGPVSEQPPLSGQPSEQQGKETGPASPESAPSSVQPEAAGNTPPRIVSFDVSPQHPVIGDKIKAKVVTSDKEGDTVNVAYEWSKNDVSLYETSDTLTVSNDFKRGDRISLRVIPDDGKLKGTPLTMNIFVADAAPVINPSQATFRFDGSTYTYQVKATDPDGDPLTYTLKAGPPGMTVDPSTGLITWPVPTDFKGIAQITISVTDGFGGETMESFTVNIPPEQKK